MKFEVANVLWAGGVVNTGAVRPTLSLVVAWSILNSSSATNPPVKALLPCTIAVLGLGLSLDNGCELALAVKSFDTTWAEAAVVVVGLILWAVEGTGSVLAMDILDPTVMLFGDISAICIDVAVLPPKDVLTLPPFTITALGLGSPLGNGSELEPVVELVGSTAISTGCADTTSVGPTVVVLGLILSAVKGTGSVLVMGILEPIVALFDDISAICTGGAVLPSNDVSALPPFTITALGMG